MSHAIRRSSVLPRRMLRSAASAALVLSGVLLSACSDTVTTLEPTDATHQLTVRAGQPFDIVLQTIGPGEYATPPQIVPAVIEFLSVVSDGPANPGGPRQRFHFRAVAAGAAVITFVNAETSHSLVDTITIH